MKTKVGRGKKSPPPPPFLDTEGMGWGSEDPVPPGAQKKNDMNCESPIFTGSMGFLWPSNQSKIGFKVFNHTRCFFSLSPKISEIFGGSELAPSKLGRKRSGLGSLPLFLGGRRVPLLPTPPPLSPGSFFFSSHDTLRMGHVVGMHYDPERVFNFQKVQLRVSRARLAPEFRAGMPLPSDVFGQLVGGGDGVPTGAEGSTAPGRGAGERGRLLAAKAANSAIAKGQHPIRPTQAIRTPSRG